VLLSLSLVKSESLSMSRFRCSIARSRRIGLEPAGITHRAHKRLRLMSLPYDLTPATYSGPLIPSACWIVLRIAVALLASERRCCFGQGLDQLSKRRDVLYRCLIVREYRCIHLQRGIVQLALQSSESSLFARVQRCSIDRGRACGRRRG